MLWPGKVVRFCAFGRGMSLGTVDLQDVDQYRASAVEKCGKDHSNLLKSRKIY